MPDNAPERTVALPTRDDLPIPKPTLVDRNARRRAGQWVNHLRLRIGLQGNTPKPVPIAIFKVTDACNAHCTTCNVGQPGYRAVSPRMPREMALRIVGQLGLHRVLFLGIVGGEPLLYPHVMDVLALCTELGMRVNLNTHAGLLDAATARELGQRQLGYASISLDSPDPVRNDAIRKGAPFASAVAGIGFLHQFSPGTSVSIGMTLTRANLSEAAAMCRFAATIGVRYVKFQPMHLHLDQAVETPDMRKDLAFDAADLPALLHALAQAQDVANTLGVKTNARMLAMEMPDLLGRGRHLACVAGKTVLFIDAQGRVGGCPQERTRRTLLNHDLAELLALEAEIFQRAQSCPDLPGCFDTTYGELSHLQHRRGASHALDVVDRLLFYGQP